MNLDFTDIKDDLKSYLQAQTEFSDYQFEGSGLSVLLDVMAYATHYNALMANAVVNESFLDTAQRRNSIVSHAKTLGYTPSTTKAAQATVRLTFNEAASNENNTIGVTIERGSKFIGTYQGESYPFVTTDAYTTPYPYTVDVVISQGEYYSKTFTWHDNTVQHFVLNEGDIDVTSISLMVNGVYWAHNDGDLSNVDESSTVFYTQENYDGKIEIYFGPDSGLFGVHPNDGNTIEVEYIRSLGAIVNGADVFSIPGLIGGYDAQAITISTVDAASLGADPEPLEDVRFRAPKNYERQNRTVTAEDYKAIIAEKFTDVASINVWGGETNNPPQFGKVMITIKPESSTTLSPMTKDHIINEVLAQYAIVGITPVIIDPEYIYITVNSRVTYFKNKTSRSQGEMMKVISDVVEAKFDATLRDFDSVLRYSTIVKTIDDSETSVVSNITDIQMSKQFHQDTTNTYGVYTMKYYNAIKPGTVISSELINTGQDSKVLMDDGLGNMTLYNINQEVFESVSIGTVDYTNGTVYLDGFTPTLDLGQLISIYAVPNDTDVESNQNALILFYATNIEMVAI